MLPLRDENPTRRLAVVTLVIIAVNVAVFFGVNSAESEDPTLEVAIEYGAIPCELAQNRPLTVEELPFDQDHVDGCTDQPVTPEAFPDKRVWLAVLVSMFLHQGIIHLAANMWFLWIFGNNVEDHLGRIWYPILYLAGGVVATLTHVVPQTSSTAPLIGASGAVATVMGAYLVWFPDAQIRTLIFIIPFRMRAVWWLGIWFASQFLFIGGDSGIAWLAHVGGFIFGVIVGLIVRESSRARRLLWRSDGADSAEGPWDTRHGGRSDQLIPTQGSPVVELRGLRRSSDRPSPRDQQ